MSNWLRVFCLLLICLTKTTYANTLKDAIDISVISAGQLLPLQYQIIIDKQFQLELPDVVNSEKWQIPPNNKISWGVEPQAIWMKFKLSNTNPDSLSISLRYLDASYQSIELFYRPNGNSKGFEKDTFIYGQDYLSQPKATMRPTFDLSIAPGELIDVYIRIINTSDFAIAAFSSFEIWPTKELIKTEHLEIFFLTGLFLLQLAIALSALVAYFATKDKSFTVYAVFAAATSISLAGMDGIWPYFVDTQGYHVRDIMLPLNIMHLTAFIFVSMLLQLKQRWIAAWRFMQAWIWFAAISLIFDLVGLDMLSRYMVEISALNYVSICIIAFICWRKGVPDALLLTLTWSIFTIGAFMQPMRNWGLIEHSFVSQWLLYVGVFIETWLLVVVMGLRLARSAEEKTKLHTEYQHYLETSASKLESLVAAKTEELRAAKEEAEKDARTDVLTGIANRRSFWEGAKQTIDKVTRHKGPLHVIIIDIDNFKQLNDEYGHAVGDAALKLCAEVLQNNSRSYDLVSRLGGEEFAILVTELDSGGVYEFSERLRQQVQTCGFKYGGLTIPFTISLGVASWQPGQSLDQLLKNADKALYMAKTTGKNKVLNYHESWQSD